MALARGNSQKTIAGRHGRRVRTNNSRVSAAGTYIRWFLAYSSSSRSPNPHHLAVLARHGFVGGCSHPLRHLPEQAAPSYTALLRQGRRRRSLTSTQIVSASRRTWIEA